MGMQTGLAVLMEAHTAIQQTHEGGDLSEYTNHKVRRGYFFERDAFDFGYCTHMVGTSSLQPASATCCICSKGREISSFSGVYISAMSNWR